MSTSPSLTTANLGFPRIGARRELKTALEARWRGTLTDAGLDAAARELRASHWKLQQEAGIGHIPSNDFALYDQVLDAALLVGAAPERFAALAGNELLFACARGTASAAALEMTKWFDTNYHYLVPEIGPETTFRLVGDKPVAEFREALALGIRTRPVLIGPVTFLLLAKSTVDGVAPLAALDRLLPVYEQLLAALAAAGATWIQIDEPCLATDLPPAAAAAYRSAYARLAAVDPRLRLCLTTYFGDLAENADLACALPVHALHVDLVRAPEQLDGLLSRAPAELILSLGVVDGRNIWAADRDRAVARVRAAVERRGAERVWVAPSCSLLHVPVSLVEEHALDPALQARLAFATEKLAELGAIARGERGGARPAAKPATPAAAAAELHRASPYAVRSVRQHARLALPLLPTTTIGSFPQTKEVRALRASWRKGSLPEADYRARIAAAINDAVRWQEDIGVDVLVHGEFERTDMVEFFAEHLAGVAMTANGWVQSYGSRCVKPPVIHGDVARLRPTTVAETRFAQSLTAKPVKGMLTGPITILQWSFVRDDATRAQVCQQLARALRDEILDLEAAGIAIIQVDEPAFREGLPLRVRDRAGYLQWAVDCFRLATAGVRDETQIHTHMCYSEFGDILEHIERLDADVISIETARSKMELLDAFTARSYPLEIGPGVWDIHSPRVPTADEMAGLLRHALRVVPAERVWVNPDCGLKTRDWAQVRPAIANLVAAAKQVRAGLMGGAATPGR